MAVSSTAITKPALAEEEASENTPQTPEAPAEANEEWDGVINDPAPANEPTTEPTPAPSPVVTNVVTTVTPPQTTPKAATPAPVETTAEAPVEAPAETPTEPKPELSEPEAEEIAEPTENTEAPEVPDTYTPSTANTDNGLARKISLLALISTAIVYFSGIEIWGLTKLTKIIKNEKLVKTAKKKAAKVKDTKLSRTA